MSKTTLLDSWWGTRAHPDLWRAFLSNKNQEPPAVLVGRPLVDPLSPVDVCRSLLKGGWWEAAELYLEDDWVGARLEEGVRQLALDELRGAREASRLRVQRTWDELAKRAEVVGIPCTPLQELAFSSQFSIDLELANLRHQIDEAEEKKREQIRRQFNAKNQDASTLDRLLQLDLKAAEEAANRGGNHIQWSLPAPPVTDFWRVPIVERLSMALGEELAPPGFREHLPPRTEAAAWRLLERLLRGTLDQGGDLLNDLGAVLGMKVNGACRQIGGWEARVVDLCAEGFHALSPSSFPDGLRLWMPDRADLPDPEAGRHRLSIRLILDSGGGEDVVTPGELRLHCGDILAVLSPLRYPTLPERRNAILACLGAQIPVRQLFDGIASDLTTVWRDDELVEGLTRPGPVWLVVGAPGMGKSVLLRALSQKLGVSVHPATVDELPEQPTLLIEATESLDARGARRLVSAIHFARSAEEPPRVVVVARPEVALALESVRRGFFTRKDLKPKQHAVIRHQIATLLAWGGLFPDEPALIDVIAHLSAGNPGIMGQICRALSHSLGAGAASQRRFSAQDVAALDTNAALSEALRLRCWEPIAASPGVAEIVKALHHFGQCDGLNNKELGWAIEVVATSLPESILLGALNVLEAYGHLWKQEDRWMLSSALPTTLLRSWTGLP
jgi:hypothetical protein